MNELFITIAVLPVIFLVSAKSQSFSKGFAWLPSLVALLCVMNSLYLHIEDPQWWGPVASFFALGIAELFENRKMSSLSLFCFAFIAQALLTSDIANIVVCLALADTCLNIEVYTSTKLEDKNSAIHNIYKSLFSFFPVLLGILLQLRGDPFTAMVVLTIAWRLFSWPVARWHAKSSRYSGLLIMAGSTFSLWHVLDFSVQPEWAIVWFGLAALLSFGASTLEMYLALSLGVFCISPGLGVVSTAGWPLLLHRGRANPLVLLLVGALGTLISDFSAKIILENALYGIVVVGALAIARPFVSFRSEKRVWFKELADIILSLGLFVLLIYLIPLPLNNPSSVGLTFLGLFIASYILGLAVIQKKPKFFKVFAPLLLPQILDPAEPMTALKETAGEVIHFKERPFVLRVYGALESESHIAWLLGALGVALIWGLK